MFVGETISTTPQFVGPFTVSNDPGLVVPMPTFPRKLCAPENVFAAARFANDDAGKPPRRLAFRFGTWVVEVTDRGAVPVAAVETNCPLALTFPCTVSLPVKVAPGNVWPDAKLMAPFAPIESPVGAGAPDPDPKSRFREPDGLALLLPTGSAYQRKCWLTAAPVPLLNAEPSKSKGCELNPFVAVAVPVEGS